MNDTTMTGRDAVFALFDALLHMAAFGTREYRKLDADRRAEFADLIRAGDLGFVFERLKVVATLRRVKLPPDLLAERADNLSTPPVTAAKRTRARELAAMLVPVLTRRRGRPRSRKKAEALRLHAVLRKAGATHAQVWEALKRLGHEYDSPDSLPRMQRARKK